MKKPPLKKIYTRLKKSFGHQNWWPADSAEEVMFGAVLTQNTSWKNAEQALAALKAEKKLTFKAISATTEKKVAQLIRPARFFNQKAKALKTFAEYFGNCYGFSIGKMKKQETAFLREELLSLFRIGPETADSILLYALEKPVFIIDAYTRRIFSRHGFLRQEDSYDDFQKFFMDNLLCDTGLYNDYHAQLVCVGNLFCSPKPCCAECPLLGF